MASIDCWDPMVLTSSVYDAAFLLNDEFVTAHRTVVTVYSAANDPEVGLFLDQGEIRLNPL